MKRHYSINSNWWDERAKIHKDSDYYNLKKFNQGEVRLRDFEIDEIGSVKGKSLIHLQCHLGIETISWAKLGAEVTGVDFSKESINIAVENAKLQNVKADFIHANVYDVLKKVENKFDIVYVSVGSLHWLGDIDKWAKIASSLLKKGGFLYVYEFHPISNVLSEDRPEFVRDYFDRKYIMWDEDGSYTDSENRTNSNKHIIWDRPLSDILNSIINAGLKLELINERAGQEYKQFDYYEMMNNRLWYSKKGIVNVPATITIKARK